MADDKTNTGGADRRRVAKGEGYEVSYFARKHGLSTEEARRIIKRVGNDREKLDAEVGKMRADKRIRGAKSGRRAVGTRTTKIAKAAALGGAVAAGALLWSRRDQVGAHFGRLADGIRSRGRTSQHSEGFAAQGTTGETSAVSPAPRSGGDGRSQAEIAEEALTLKETGQRRPE